MENLMTVGTVAERLGLSEQSVRKHIRSGNLTATKFGAAYLIEVGDLRRFAAIRRKAGRPPKACPTCHRPF